MNPKSAWPGIIGGGAFLVVGGLLFASEIHRYVSFRHARTWPTAPGVMESINGNCHRSHRAGRWCNVRGRYRYQVGNVNYVGRRITFDDADVGYVEQLDSLIHRYWKGAAVDVYYDPSDPTTAVLDRRNRLHYYEASMFAGGAAAGVLLLVAAFWKRRAATESP